MIDIRATVRAIATIYDTESAARAALIRIDYPAASIPLWDKPELFWSAIIQDLVRGRIQDGVLLLVSGALQEYPANRQLPELMARISEDTAPSRSYLDGRPMALPPISDSPGASAELAWHNPRKAIGAESARDGTREIAGPATEPSQKKSRFNLIRRTRDTTQVSLRNLRSIEFQSLARRLELIGAEQYDFDNSESSATSVETLRIFNSTQFILKFDTGNAVLRGGQSAIGILDFAKIQGQLQSNLLSQYSLSEQTTLTVERTSQINIPAQAHVRVVVNWKRVWQDGVVILRTRSGVDVEIPYSITIDLIFDKTLTDIPSDLPR